jgi:hypothetical protein
VTGPTTPAGWAIFAWGTGGVLAVLLQAIVRIAPLAGEALDGELTGVQRAVAVIWTVFMLYTESWRGFHQRFSPRVVVRSLAIAAEPRPLLVLLAPVVVMGLAHATPRRMLASWLLVIGIVAIVVAMQAVPQPWRGIVDLGVVLGLAAGAASLVYHAGCAVVGRPPAVAAEFPEP